MTNKWYVNGLFAVVVSHAIILACLILMYLLAAGCAVDASRSAPRVVLPPEAPPAECAPGAPAELPGYIKLVGPGGWCSGAAIGPDLVVTAAHCVELGDTDTAWAGTAQYRVLATAARGPSGADLAVLRVTAMAGVTALAPARYAPARGDAATQYGEGCGADHAERSRPHTLLEIGGPVLYFSGCSCHGDSGGPVLDAAGDLVGVTSFGFDDNLVMGVAPIDDLDALIARLP